MIMVYILFDTALNGLYTLMILQKNYPENRSLFEGTKDKDLFDVAPYIFKVDEFFFEKIADPYVSMEAMVAFEAESEMDVLVDHFHQFMYQKINGRENYFRFWDARVLARFLPACNDSRLNDFFEGISCYYRLENKDNSITKYFIKRGKLQTDILPMNKLFVLPEEDEPGLQNASSGTADTDKQKKVRKDFFK